MYRNQSKFCVTGADELHRMPTVTFTKYIDWGSNMIQHYSIELVVACERVHVCVCVFVCVCAWLCLFKTLVSVVVALS